MLPGPEDFGILYHEIYNGSSNLKKKVEWKKLKKKLTNYQCNVRNKIDLLYENDTKAPRIELPKNASAFAVFASVRLAILDRWMYGVNQEHWQSSCNKIPILEQTEIESDTEDNFHTCHLPITVSKVVSLGLRSVFELIKESRITHPSLCTKALLALLNVLQGQPPEGLKSEPSEVTDPLFELLLDLATLHGPESSVPNDGSHLTAVSCACLLSLVVARGETGKYLSATAALLMCPRALSFQNIKMPSILCSLQRSVYAVLLEKCTKPEWITHGVTSNSKIDSFCIKLPSELIGVPLIVKSLCCDGQYFYLFTSKGLLKIGCGFGGTEKGTIMLWKADFYPNDNGVLLYCGGHLYLKLCGRRGDEFLIVDKTNLLIIGSVLLHNKDASSPIIFSDGDYLGIISPTKDDAFVVRMLNYNTSPASVISELPIKLAKKCVEVCGTAFFDDEVGNYSVNIGNEEVDLITAGKEFGLISTVTGKVFYCGKSSALGIKQAGIRSGKWSELILTQSPKVNHIAVGHDGLHAIIITEDGSVFFTGTARRGEDGDQNKVRRQPKPVKPRKIIRVDGHHIISGACNNGTTALINENGELIMFGKDTTHADPTTGIVTSLKDEFITQVALGKAHTVALTNKGQVYTFGINNKHQCGRDFNSSKSGNFSQVVAMDTCGVHEEHDFYNETDINHPNGVDKNITKAISSICPPGTHSWHDDMCMVCSVCRECTGYSVSCLSSISPDRNPGQVCGCGEGDSGCAICGCCRICAREVMDNSELADLGGIIKFDLIFHNKTSSLQHQRCKLQEQMRIRLDEKKNKSKRFVQGLSKQPIKSKSSKSGSNVVNITGRTSGTGQTDGLEMSKDQSGSDIERDTSRVSCLPPAKISLPPDSPVIQIACGLHHTILLLQNGQVYTFGSNLYGQLGCGDILSRNSIQLVKFPSSAVLVAAGSNHSVVLTSKGEVYTFGNNQKSQLGRSPSGFSSQDIMQPGHSSNSRNNPRAPWYSFPGPIPNIGPKYGRKATWVGASGDQTFLKIDESLINTVSLMKSTVVANKNSIVLLPRENEIIQSFKCIVISKKDGTCNYFRNQSQVNFANKIVCMDHIYNVVWSYDTINNEFICYNIIASELQTIFLQTVDNKLLCDMKAANEIKSPYKKIQLPSILSPELALPVLPDSDVTRFQAALNLLCCLDILTTAHELQLSASKEEVECNKFIPNKQYSKEDFQAVNRFESYGGGWGYSGHSVEAIRFMTDTDILLGGFGLYGGRGEYTAKLKLIDIGPDGGEQETDGELLAETEEMPYECGPRQKFSFFFDEPIHLQALRWYIAWCRISGPSSDCGSSGQAMVTTEDQVIFYFKSSKKSNNGTDVNAGQIPQLLYKIILPESQSPPKQSDITESVHILSKDFSRTVSKDCFQSLLSLLQWSWNTFKWGVIEGQTIKCSYNNLELEKLVYISKASLHLLCTYINDIYPKHINTRKLSQTETVDLSVCVGDTRTLLKQILSDNIPTTLQLQDKTKVRKDINVDMMNEILEDCHNTFVACFHAFYPTVYLKWNCLCNLLEEINKDTSSQCSGNERLLSAVLCALCAPCVRLRSIFQLHTRDIINSENYFHRCLSPIDDTGLPMLNISGFHHYPLLVDHMTYKSQAESNSATVNYQWSDILECLINLASNPVLKKLKQCDSATLPDLTKYCCHLLAKALAELVLQCNIAEDEYQSCGRTLYVTPSRFSRVNQSRTWNTGNGSPDAICFQVDREGISIVGVGVYGGIGHYEYELELLEDTSSLNGDSQKHAHRWNSLEIKRGSYGPEDFATDVIEIRFDRSIPIKENIKYAVRLRNHGGRTNNGDGGLTCVKGPDNTTFTFATCSLSFNGTTLTRGQIPVLLYYSNPLDYGRSFTSKSEEQATRTALSVASKIIGKANDLMVLAREKSEEVPSASILSSSCFVTSLLPLVFAHLGPLATNDSRSAVYILNLIQELLPHVAALNLIETSSECGKFLTSSNSFTKQDVFDNMTDTTSKHYILVESDHPYKVATVTNYRVTFPSAVKWMSIEFDPACSTTQPEDSLQLYVPAIDYSLHKRFNHADDTDITDSPYWPVLHKFSGSFQWPTTSVILPGNEVIFSLETASDYLKDEKLNAYGFKCLVVGYEWPLEGNLNLNTGLKNVEAELSFLGGMCTSSLIKKDLLLPSIEGENHIDIETAEIIASEIWSQHSSLLAKGLALNSPPSVQQALDGTLPYSVHSNERLFLRDFVYCVAGTSGGRLAQWLQPGSRVDPNKSQVLYSREELHCGWPAIVTIITRDQYSDLVYVPNMKVDVKAMPVDKKPLGDCDSGRKIPRISHRDTLSFGDLPPPPLHHSYEPTIRDKMCFHSITVMKAYQNYSFEELRYTSPSVQRSDENMTVRSNCDGTYSATWTPASIGCYSIIVTIDGYDMEEVFKVEVKEPPQGILPPNQNLAKKSSHKPNKLRKFVAKNSAGLRVRAHPSLQSEQIGVVHVNGTIAFIDEIHNDDGVWLRLSAETIKQYCTVSVMEAWCLQYNQHLGKTLLLPVEEPKSILDQIVTEAILRKMPETEERSNTVCSNINYQVIKCGASGHNIRCRPSLNAPPVGMLILGNKIGVTEYTINSDGCWVLLDEDTKEKYCFNTEGDAWSLAIGQHNTIYLGNISELDSHPKVNSKSDDPHFQNKGFNFSHNWTTGSSFSFSGEDATIVTSPVNPKKATISNPFVFGENTPESPKISKKGKKKQKRMCLYLSSNETSANVGENSTIKHISLFSANDNGTTNSDTSLRSQSSKGSIQSDTNALVSSITKDTSSSSQTTQPIEASSSPTGSSFHMHSESGPSDTANVKNGQVQVTQTGTQTSPDKTDSVHTKGHFSIGIAGKEEKVSPKSMRKDRTSNKIRLKRAISPAHLQQLPANSKMIYPGKESVKKAMSPGVAESLRAVFAAFLWHEGIVHDAMACASFLKFHPTLPKQGAAVTTRHLELSADKKPDVKSRQRHSVEVTNAGNYLHIQPSTLESLTRSAANANANRNRKKVADNTIKEGEKFGDNNYKYQTISVLPPALKSLVYLWEELSSSCIQAVSQNVIVPGPIVDGINKADKLGNTIKNDTEGKSCTADKEKKCKKKKLPSRNYLDIGLSNDAQSSGVDTFCELCGDNFPFPVTYHMHQAHPGCGQHAGGKGYNSSGNYCLGWAGNCGDGGIPGSSWYLLCDSCREKYVETNTEKRQINFHNKSDIQKKNCKNMSQRSSPAVLEPHIVMKKNAMFLLDLASSSESGIRRPRSSVNTMPSVSEDSSPPENTGPFDPLPPFQCLDALGANVCCNNASPFNYDLLNQHNYQENFMAYPSTSGQRPLSEVTVSDSDIDGNKGIRFHRSISMGTNGFPWSKSGYDGRVVMMRKRNNSSCEVNDGVSSLLCNPSNALQKLLRQKDSTSAVVKYDDNVSSDNSNLLERPVLRFILQQHDLDSLQFSMKRALRKAMCRAYAMQALNWLLRSVTQTICLHDLLWWFVTSLTPAEIDSETEEDNTILRKDDEQDIYICEHPLSDIAIAGEAVHPLPIAFHSLLQTIADIMVLLPMGSALQQIAVRCWGIRFTTADHKFLHRSQVFSNISKILSRSEEVEAFMTSLHETYSKTANSLTPSIECLKDLTPLVEIKASSRQAMVGSLTDNSTETFWESGDEDRNKTKIITIISPQGHYPTLACVHIDNCRDLGNKVSSITFFCGQNTDELIKLRTVEVETRLLGGWVNCPIMGFYNVIRLELKGPDNCVRVRQVRILGKIDGESLQIENLYSPITLQQKNCENETLRVFRLITSQVFGELLQGEDGQTSSNTNAGYLLTDEDINPHEESNDLREHMVGILFSRSKLTHLQKQVIVHIVQAIRRETERVHEEWESNLYNSTSASPEEIRNSDRYCFEMLSMVLALSGSAVGRAYLSHQYDLLRDLIVLLQTGSARVQRQVTSLLRRMLSEITPETFTKIVGIKKLPVKDLTNITAENRDCNSGNFDIDQVGVLDVFLSVIAKALTVQVKIRGKNGNTGAHKETNTVTLTTCIHKESLHKRWWLKGTVSKKLAEIIIQLIKDMASGTLSESWAKIAKGAIAENILHLTYLTDEQKLPNNCLKTPTLWLALASLCVLDTDHVEKLSSGQWRQADTEPVPPRPTCCNHDDGETVAVIQCSYCGNLCAECDRYLHLHKKTRNHQRQVCKEEEEAIKVELHEGCGRTKLFWLLALADPGTLKALVEFREGGMRTKGVGITGACRFCGTTGNSGLLAIGNVCADHECQEYAKTACTKILNCGHMCGGVLGETKCLPCLLGCSNDTSLKQDSDDMCMICFTEALSCAPAIQLQCGHVFHSHCCKTVLLKRWAGPRITFSFLLCPICKVEMYHESLEELLTPVKDLYKDVRRKALMRLEYEGLNVTDDIVTSSTRFSNDPASYAMDRYAYYVCYKCNKAYYGGDARCDVELVENYDPTELVCGACSDIARAQMCPKHGTDFLEYKCRYCCSVAVFFCFGTTHFCNPCHDDFQRVTNLSKSELPVCPAGPRAKQLEGDECPLHVKHPPTGEEFALGCGVCRNAHTF